MSALVSVLELIPVKRGSRGGCGGGEGGMTIELAGKGPPLPSYYLYYLLEYLTHGHCWGLAHKKDASLTGGLFTSSSYTQDMVLLPCPSPLQ